MFGKNGWLGSPAVSICIIFSIFLMRDLGTIDKGTSGHGLCYDLLKERMTVIYQSKNYQ